jgi:SAM-dependent methyltransferase
VIRESTGRKLRFAAAGDSAATGLYGNRLFSLGYPNLEKLGVDYFNEAQPSKDDIHELMYCLRRLIELSKANESTLVVGCGPKPRIVEELLQAGHNAYGVEPVEESAALARKYLGDQARIRVAGAESLPFRDASQSVVILDCVLEHVDSPLKSLAECHRVLKPGGVLYIYTTNRLRFSLTGRNGEFRILFYNWFPDVVKEGYILNHLHYNPSLANYTPRPAVHWFTYAQLCKLGRLAGFAQFYSRVDLLSPDSPSMQSSAWRRFLLPILRSKLHRNPWLRALALSQFGNSIFMLKRPE